MEAKKCNSPGHKTFRKMAKINSSKNMERASFSFRGGGGDRGAGATFGFHQRLQIVEFDSLRLLTFHNSRKVFFSLSLFFLC